MKIYPGEVHIQRQPTETSCGPTCLQAIYAYYGVAYSIEKICNEVLQVSTGGTLAVNLGKHALKSGFDAKIYTFNILIFDPSWFYPHHIGAEKLVAKLQKQKRVKRNPKLGSASKSYIDFLNAGGQVVMEDLSPDLLVRYLSKMRPLLTGLSSTYLYQSPREMVRENKQISDDVQGVPEGHFVILEKYDSKKQLATIADPFATNPFSRNLRYNVPLSRLVTAILLGVLTYDANFLVIEPKEVKTT